MTTPARPPAVRRIAAFFRAELKGYAARKDIAIDGIPGDLKFFGSPNAPVDNHVTAAEIRAFLDFAELSENCSQVT